MKFGPDYDPWICAGILVRIDWTSRPRQLPFWDKQDRRVETGDVVVALQTPLGSLTPVLVERKAREVVA